MDYELSKLSEMNTLDEMDESDIPSSMQVDMIWLGLMYPPSMLKYKIRLHSYYWKELKVINIMKSHLIF